jgi:3-deoxy-manno-octulosonate cytidylyltransferase (CMP-KDO synthetase)
MSTIGIIPARYQSSRFPGKPLAKIGDKSMIQRVYERCRLAGLDKVLIATDDERIADHAKDFNANVIMTSADCKTGTERCYEAYSKLDEKFDNIINIQGDEPFIDPNQIMLISKAFEEEEVQIATLAEKFEKKEELFSENTAKIVKNHQDFALYFSRSVVPFVRDAKKDNWLKNNTFWKHIGIYGFRSEVLKEISKLQSIQIEESESLEQLRWLYFGFKIKVIETKYFGVSVDTPKDLEKANEILTNIYL